MSARTSPEAPERWPVDVAGFPLELPIVPIRDDFAISLMMVIDLGVRFGEHVGKALAERLRPLAPEVVVGAATLGIPIAIEVTRHLGLDRYVILQKSPKLHLADARVETIVSITSKGEQRLLLDRAAEPLIAGRRIVVVDDVVATGGSLRGSLSLVRAAGAEVAGIGVVLTEAHAWRKVLGPDAPRVTALAHIPQFRRTVGKWEPIPESL